MKSEAHLFSFIILWVCSLLSCNDINLKTGDYIILDQWEVNTGKGWIKTGIVPWETTVEEGGPGALDYNGFGYYRTTFSIPDRMLDGNLAFYTDCLDDSDIGILNGHIIGETGKVPPENVHGGSIDISTFRSGVREARLYVVPAQYLSGDKKNELVLKVYDFSGAGGFCHSQKPVIGPYNELKKMEARHRNINDIPRLIFLSFLFYLVIFHSIKLSVLCKVVSMKKMLSSIIQPLNIKSFLFSRGQDDFPDIDVEIAARYFLSILICIMSFFFLFSEVTYKYYFIESEIFWFKMPPVLFFAQLGMLLSMFHRDVFGQNLSGTGGKVMVCFRAIMSVVPHPLTASVFLVYSSVIPADKTWSHFIFIGLGYGFVSITILFGITGINMIKSSRSGISRLLHTHFQWEGIFRLLLIFFMITTFVLSMMYVFLGHQSLIMNFFLILYMLMSISFLSGRRITLPIKSMDGMPLFVNLQKNFSLTYKESAIACLMHEGYSRNDICKRLDITNETIKKHLQSMYKKTINRESGINATGRDKFQRFTFFLNRLSSNVK